MILYYSSSCFYFMDARVKESIICAVLKVFPCSQNRFRLSDYRCVVIADLFMVPQKTIFKLVDDITLLLIFLHGLL